MIIKTSKYHGLIIKLVNHPSLPKALFCSNINAVLQIVYELQG